MNEVAQTSEAQRLVGFLAIAGLVCYFLVRYLKRWLSRPPLLPDPWDDQVSADLAAGKGAPICHRCLVPHDPLINFCSACGAPVGQYTNWMPYPYLFTVGHTLRIGTSGTFRRSPLTIGGFILLAFAEYAMFAPIYWLRMFLNISNEHLSSPPETANSGREN